MSSWFHTLSPAAQGALRGVLLTITACALFSLLDSATKYAGMLLPMVMVVWMRFLAQALVTSALVLPRHGLKTFRTGHLKLQLIRAVAGFMTTVCAFFCIQSMPLANFTAIWAAAPLFIVVISALLFGERVSWPRWLLLILGLIAVVAAARPETAGQSLGWAALWPVGLLICGISYQVIGSRLARLDPPATTQMFTSWLPVLLTLPLVPLIWQPIPDWTLLAAAAVMGLCSGIGHLLLLHAFASTSPAIVSPFLYSQIGFAMLLGWLFFNQVPDALSLTGMVVVTLCGLISVWLGVREKPKEPAQNRAQDKLKI